MKNCINLTGGLRIGLSLIYIFLLLLMGGSEGKSNIFLNQASAAAAVDEDELANPSFTSKAAMAPTHLPIATEIKTVVAFVNVWSLRVRAGAGIDTSMIAGLIYEDRLSLVGRNAEGSWVKFSHGWVASEYLVLEGDIRELPILTGELDLMAASAPGVLVTLQASNSGTEVGEARPTPDSAPSASPRNGPTRACEENFLRSGCLKPF
jgi:hypothetical protein